MCLWIGLQPSPMLKAIVPSAQVVLANYPAAVEQYHAQRRAPAVDPSLVFAEPRDAQHAAVPGAPAALGAGHGGHGGDGEDGGEELRP